MTASDRFDQLFADALQDLAGDQYPDYFDDVLDAATRRSQRPAWTFLERWIPMDTATRRTVIAPTFPWRTVGLIVVIIALLIATAAVVIIGSQPSAHPAPPFGLAANGLVAYGADGDVFVRDTHGGPARKVVGTDDYDVFPNFSRDGTQIVFVRLEGVSDLAADEPTAEVLWIAKADGSDPRQLLSADTIPGFSWSVDGTQIAVIDEANGKRSLRVMDVDDGASRVLAMDVEPLEGVDWRPPDGRELIFRGRVGAKYAIYGIRPDGTNLRQISADGTDQDYWLAAGSNHYAVTPDGNKLVYGQSDTRVDLRMLDLDTREDALWGGALEVFHTEGGPAFLGHWGGAVLSPDGKHIAFGRYWDEHSGTLYHQVFVGTLAGDGADAIPIGVAHRSQGGRDPFGYDFSPDGKFLIIRDHIREVTWLVNPQDGSSQAMPWGNVIDTPNWQRVAPE